MTFTRQTLRSGVTKYTGFGLFLLFVKKPKVRKKHFAHAHCKHGSSVLFLPVVKEAWQQLFAACSLFFVKYFGRKDADHPKQIWKNWSGRCLLSPPTLVSSSIGFHLHLLF